MNSLSIKATPVINELMNSLSIKASIIRIVLPIAADWLISFHVNVNSLLPLPSVHPPMPPLFYTLQWTPWALGWFVMCLLGLQFFLPWLKWYIYIYIYIYSSQDLFVGYSALICVIFTKRSPTDACESSTSLVLWFSCGILSIRSIYFHIFSAVYKRRWWCCRSLRNIAE